MKTKNTKIIRLYVKTLFTQILIAITTISIYINCNITAVAQVNGNQKELLDAIKKASNNNGTVTIGKITMLHNANGIIIGGDSSGGIKSNLTIKGTKASNFNSIISTIVSQIDSLGNNVTKNNISTYLSAASFNTTDLSSIVGDGTARDTDKTGYANAYKWFTTDLHNHTSSGSNGLGFQNILFDNVTINYNFDLGTDIERKFVNGLIGNRFSAGTADTLQAIPGSPGVYGTSLGKLTGNEFSNITITLEGKQDTNYLAGGGIIGVRNTGELAKESNIPTPNYKKFGYPLSAEMDVVSGNYFHDIKVITTEANKSNNMTLLYDTTASAYLEGGGIIGVNGVSSPGEAIGHALLKGLENNAFTGINILSNDILLGGGIVGVNNNSKDTTGDVTNNQTYSKINYVTGNIFGNGTDESITVKVGYSLRGGGVVGLNGLGSAQIDLPTLTNNVFAGIDVTTGSYLKGGGIVGLQNNDSDYNKGGSPIADFDAAYVQARDVSGNVFINLDVSVGNGGGTSQYLQGGGIIGLRSDEGIAILNELKDNVFKDITVTLANAKDKGLLGGGVVGVYSVDGYASMGEVQNNYFNNTKISVAGTITGGGVIGVANSTTKNFSSVAADISYNTFSNIKVKTDDGDPATTTANLIGGGVIGISSGYLSIARSINNNQFIGNSADTEIDISIDGAIKGGGVIGSHTGTNAYSNTIEDISGNRITNYNVNADSIDGGGLIGIYAEKSYAELQNFTGNTLNNNKIEADNITGGGLIGIYAEKSYAELQNFTGNTLNYNKIEADSITGGGLVGIYAKQNATLISAINNNKSFNYNNITVTGTITGGGIWGVYSTDGNAEITTATNNKFNNNTISSVKLIGGGIIGVYSANNGYAKIETINNNTFNNSEIKVTGTDGLIGGGIIGVSSASGYARIKNLTNNTFDNSASFMSSTVTVAGDLKGGGIIGVSASSNTNPSAYAEIDQIVNNIFKSTVSVTGKLEGGGIIGVEAEKGAARINNISGIGIKGLFFIKEISAASIEGGGLIGVRSDEGNASINTISNVAFSTNNINTTNGNIEGAGLIGVRSDKGNATMNSITNSTFTSNTITTINGYIQGGGIIGVRSDSLAKINSISNSIFNTNTVTSAKWIDGGGIIGASGSAKGNGKEPHGGIGLIDHTSFIGNTIKANDGQIMGGLIYSYGAAGGMTIKDSLFGLNEFYSKITTPIADYNAKVYGAITIDTGATLYTGDKEHVVTLISTALEQDAATGFYKNAIYEDNNTTTPNRYNSFYFGTMPYVDGGDLQQDYAAANARLVIASEANGYVFLLDPIAVSQKNKTEIFTFNMDIGHKNGSPSGLLIWGGKNKFELLKNDGTVDENNSGTITMYAGSTTSLVNMNSFTTLVNYGELWSKVFQSADSMTLEAPNYYVDLQKDAWLNIEGLNYWDLSTTVNSNSTKVKFYGDLHFNLNNTQDYDDTTIPKDYSDTLSKEYPLLTIKTPDEAGVIDLTGATVHLQDFLGDKELHAGDRFYLIEATDNNNNDKQKKFTGENQLSNDKDEDGNFIAYARQGLTRGYYFIIDLNGEHDDGDLINTRYLTARLRSAIPIPAKELIPPAESRITGVSFLNHLALPNLYNIDPQCAPEESCTPCNPCDPSYTKHTNWIRTPFISITGDWYSADTGNSSNFHIRGSVFQVGLAFQKKIHNGRLFWGAFFDNSSADYDTYNYIDEIKRNPDFHGNGELTATGGGIFIKRQWKNWQLDGLFRAGTLHNKYFNEDIHIHNTNFEMKYNTNSMYLATELGLSRQWKINKRQSLNLYSRYAWNYLDNNTITWNYETIDGDHLKFSEKVRFDHINSHRAKLGFHYLDKRTSRLSWFLDGGYEYEFDGQANGYAYGVGSFDGPRLKGGYGIGEIGFNYNKNNKFKLVSSFGGYVGNRKGININFAATWKW